MHSVGCNAVMARLCKANCNGCVVSPMGVEVVGSVCRVRRIKAVVVLFGRRVFARVLGANLDFGSEGCWRSIFVFCRYGY